jgi:ribosomal protein S18 acetylase RimI-like enzyme
MSQLRIEIVSEETPALIAAINALLPQLTSSPKPVKQEDLKAIIASPCAVLMIAQWNGALAGMLTLGWFPAPTGLRAFIDDVVVDERYRGHGIGEVLVRSALDHARKVNAKTVDLTSRPAREAANRLYRRIGFEKRETNPYRYRFGDINE